jgi:hypothetical protein
MTKTGKALAALAACAVIAAALLSPNLGEARGGGGGGHGHASNYCTICARDSHGRIARSPEARQEFMTQTGYPHGRPGYVVDHVIPLKRGGADAPWNMPMADDRRRQGQGRDGVTSMPEIAVTGPSLFFIESI